MPLAPAFVTSWLLCYFIMIMYVDIYKISARKFDIFSEMNIWNICTRNCIESYQFSYSKISDTSVIYNEIYDDL